jgi:hypothetical protein
VLLPGFTVCELGVADNTNDGGPVTLRVKLVVLVREPLVPVMVRVKLPAGVLLAVVTVSVEPLPTLTEVGLKVAVALAGSPLTLKPIEPVKPFKALVLTEYEVPPPGLTVCELGVADTVNDGAGVKGTIWIPLIGARGNPSLATPPVAERVKPVALIPNTT